MSLDYSELAALDQAGLQAARDTLVTMARASLAGAYYAARGDAIRALARMAHTEAQRAEIVMLLRDGLRAALWRSDEPNPKRPTPDANVVGVQAAAVTLARLGATDGDVVAQLREAFGHAGGKSHYELTQTTGALAIALVALGADVAADIAPVLARCEETWGDGERFIDQLRYASWIAQADPVAPATWLAEHPRHERRAWARVAATDIAQTSSKDWDVWALPLWHDLEPASEFPTIYRATDET
jgi:hypothetical protein